MGNAFFEYLQQLELMVFFCGYPLLYAIVIFFAGTNNTENNLKKKMVSGLPFGYALIGTLYLGLQLKNVYLNYSYGNVRQILHHPYLVIWGLLSILFWIPSISKRKALSLIHSLVFFFFLARDIVLKFSGSLENADILKNDMRVYITSFLLNTGAFVLILLLSVLPFSNKRNQHF